MANTDPPKQTNAKDIKQFFGFKENQTMTQFLQEFKQLTDDDKNQLGNGIRNGTLTY